MCSFQSTAGVLYLGGNDIAPSLGLKAISVKERRFLMFFPTLTIKSDPQVWLISAVEFNKELKKERKGILGISALQLFEEGEHIITVGIFHLGLQKGRFQRCSRRYS